MALTREQLDALEPPEGWKWVTKPTLRTSGELIRDEAHNWAYATMGEKFARLSEWSRANELGLKPASQDSNGYAFVQYRYTEIRIVSRFRVWANKPELWEVTFGEYTCLCGYVRLQPGKAWCQECGLIQCYTCGTAGTRLHTISLELSTGRGRAPRRRFRLLCAGCSTRCKHKNCAERVNPGDLHCPQHSTSFFCASCGHIRAKKHSIELPAFPEIPTPDRICSLCVAKYTCDMCNTFVFGTPITMQAIKGVNKKVCTLCRDKGDEDKRKELESFEPDELPVSGSMLIPVLPSRPFRTVSIETEVNGNGDYLARTLYRCGLVPISTVGGYNTHPEIESEYMAYLKHDGSVSGGELISYLMNLDDPNHAESFMDVLRKLHSLNKMGKITFDANCGGHIHVDAHNYDYVNVWRLLTGFGYAEDPIYRIAGAGCVYGHRTLTARQTYTRSPVKGPFGSKSTVGQSIREQDRMCGLNFQPYLHAVGNCNCGAWAYEDSKKCKCNLGKATIEWRVFNSTDNPRILHAWLALVQAFHAWADESDEPSPEWESNYPPLAWTQKAFYTTTAQHKMHTKARLEWMHTQLPLTEQERDSICYAIMQSDMGPELGENYVSGLMGLPNVADFEKPKSTRNPNRRQRSIKIEQPTPGKKEGPIRDARLLQVPRLHRVAAQPIEFFNTYMPQTPRPGVPLQFIATDEIEYDDDV